MIMSAGCHQLCYFYASKEIQLWKIKDLLFDLLTALQYVTYDAITINHMLMFLRYMPNLKRSKTFFEYQYEKHVIPDFILNKLNYLSVTSEHDLLWEEIE
ncbi:unnamed protein product [Adineta steineri]|uniref:Uncharacterized protein n=1 Tax=Adineta steineri TaxID=433720 RepID=A0A814CUZ7_9BILA|nr:unnamed protein product [Adineta steineri]